MMLDQITRLFSKSSTALNALVLVIGYNKPIIKYILKEYVQVEMNIGSLKDGNCMEQIIDNVLISVVFFDNATIVLSMIESTIEEYRMKYPNKSITIFLQPQPTNLQLPYSIPGCTVIIPNI